MSPLGPHSYDPGTSPTGVFWTIPISKHSVKIDLENGTASLHLADVTVFDFFTVPNSIDPVHLTPPVSGVAAATINSLDVEWSGVIPPQHEYNDPATMFAGTFLVTSATIEVIVTTSAVPAHGIHGFTFVSDATTASVFAEIGQEQNGAFYPGG